ncbi:MAG: membrane protein insertion efficiency factor YidD [Candidatus Yanofskybacteria bacterium RIFCSPLOWO2_01_FULL_49_17]|uniref:Putative membrane protein insertion efficiency factor n=1 Tax=Candidatus Yanofskybacteria bacterium RIFCSPLOWO2_01_FULL_49_17 TaxID=1802700 RepID=A0A1F8GSP9_9BACT|nr:MAG: membrane protein insertion efficiency factor YidD [Candidatus Yanofskybacteria bacterium RIFCSPLOWO2_01_FULL_49_17]
MRELLIFTIAVYQKLSYFLRLTGVPFFAATNCKFHPSCSDYAVLAIESNGAAKGSFQALKRICRCHPWSKGGLDYPS